MADLNDINYVIEEAIKKGDYNIFIDLSNYENSPNSIAVITLPELLEGIVFVSNNPLKEYNFRIVVNKARIKDIEIDLVNAYINSGNNICIDFRGEKNNTSYLNIVCFLGENRIQSTNSTGILVINEQTLKLIGIEENSVLNVYGGIRNCAIGNSDILNSGGHIIFTGQGVVNAYGGNAAVDGYYSNSEAMDGAWGIGFSKNTTESSSIIINCNTIVNVYGGNGQECNVSDSNSKASGNGGAGISLGVSGMLFVDRCPNRPISLKVKGGNGGIIVDTNQYGAMTDMRAGGNGGNGINIVSGVVNISGSAEITGGNRTSVNINKNLPVTGGKGGDAVYFEGNNIVPNTIILSSNSIVSGGNGGIGGITIGFDIIDLKIISADGGNGGNAINLGSSPANVLLDGAVLISGNGGAGGSPKAYVDFGDLNVDELKNIQGANMPATGGSNGSEIIGTGLTNLRISECTILKAGTPGNGGIGIENDGSIVEGQEGTVSKLIDVNVKGYPHFGYININRNIDISLPDNSTKNISINKSCKPKPVEIKKLFIFQTFDNIMSIDNITIQSYYNAYTPNMIYGKMYIELIINTTVDFYIKELLPVIPKKRI